MTCVSPNGREAADAASDDELKECATLEAPRSFFLYAGAGSGKTRALVAVLEHLRGSRTRYLRLRGQRIGVITYTNAACDEIKERLEFDPLVDVSTIHSFAWALIQSFHDDIRAWVQSNSEKEIAVLAEKQRKGRANSQAARDRAVQIGTARARLTRLHEVRRFVYNPSGDNRGRDALNHSEVISITAALLVQKATLRRVLVGAYPVLLVDESQDTLRELMDALLEVQQQHSERFCLGLFGDTMQRIYGHGKENLEESLPGDWAKPEKLTNYRCPKRVVGLINRVRAAVDEHQQVPRSGAPVGVVRFFVVPGSAEDKSQVEAAIAKRMATITGEPEWAAEREGYMTLTLEHHMAARRMGFERTFAALYAVDRYRTGLLDGTLPPLRFFTKEVLPVVEAGRRGDPFGVAVAVRKHSPLLSPRTLREAQGAQLECVVQAQEASRTLLGLWNGHSSPSCREVLLCVAGTGLFTVPDILRPILARTAARNDDSVGESEANADEELDAWDRVMAAPFDEIRDYERYVTGQSAFTTHQGVKGLEFPRVMVVVDDEEARGFLFSYDKLFGAKAKSDRDEKNEREGKETTVDRTRRLFYVTCSRAQSSLAIVGYSREPAMVKEHVLREGWFESDEVVDAGEFLPPCE